MTFAAMLPRLLWQVFVCNLTLAHMRQLLSCDELRAILAFAPDSRIAPTDTDSLLGNLRRQLHRSPLKLTLRHPVASVPEDFAGGMTTVVTAADSEQCIHSSARTGHDFERLPRRVRWSARKRPYFWVAPRESCDRAIYKCLGDLRVTIADRMRDLLGIVQYGKSVELVAVSFQPPPARRAFLPTAIEAMLNPRFLQTHAGLAAGNCGYTVDLKMLDSAKTGECIAGLPELLMEEASLGECPEVELLPLGVTRENRANFGSSLRLWRHMKHVLAKERPCPQCRFGARPGVP
ncbi:hypothetical protein [Steroidobacter sp.]|uniref:hypothetical protein n=1 Tax=Steroidobacter sp. TaxID=1978227 RepID=UPI001A395125|nr:hypothetical protein [Steroidobacter sp.]MBL8265589.1 hypothetical protein [Steroidobacter sp.]